jgi:hypothetical protein
MGEGMTPQRKGEWVEVREAAAIMGHNNGRTVNPDYVRILAHKGKLRYKQKDKRTNLYSREDVEGYRMRARRTQNAGTAVSEK